MSRSEVTSPVLERAYAACGRIAHQHYENFPVASRALPARMRPHVAAVYAFARHADDLADEGVEASSVRLAALDAWLDRLRAALERSSPSSLESEEDAVFMALAATIHRFDLPVGLFEDLVSAFRQDVETHRYASWDDLLDYCRRSANPVGRLVLRIAGHDDMTLDQASDHVCSALQLTNFLQDLDIDWKRGRLYVPAEIYTACGATEAGLAGTDLPPAWKASLQEMAGRTRQMFGVGREVCDAVGGRLGLELRLTWLGGCRILDRLRANGYDPRARRPTLGWSDVVPIAWKTATWRHRS